MQAQRTHPYKSIIPLKPADRRFPYKCASCGDVVVMLERLPHAIYCGECPFGAEMRPVEAK